MALEPWNQLEDFFGAHARASARGYRAAGGDEANAWKVVVGPAIDAANGPQHKATNNERKDMGFRAVNYTVFAWCWCARSSQSLKFVAQAVIPGGTLVEFASVLRTTNGPIKLDGKCLTAKGSYSSAPVTIEEMKPVNENDATFVRGSVSYGFRVEPDPEDARASDFRRPTSLQ